MVLVHKLDRLARNVADHVAVKAVLQKHKVALNSVIENIEDSASGKLIENIIASLAESQNTSIQSFFRYSINPKVRIRNS